MNHSNNSWRNLKILGILGGIAAETSERIPAINYGETAIPEGIQQELF